uniref:Acyl-coenzyme A diphosphatase NUDT19 n=1 Tax=Bos indicus x Bos taurus TaxID=30522 RepID=A0A4W2E2S6_BOBOX
MSVPVRAGPSSWRRAATLVLAAGWTRPVPAAASRPQPPAEGFRVLLLQRSASQGFLPGAQVFPGGVLEAADRSTDWLRLFAPHHGPPRFGLGRAPPQRAAFPVLPNVRPGAVDEDAAALPDDIAFRICAIRETFEEAGVLLLRPRDPRPPNQAPGCALAPPPALADWRARVRRDPRHFLSLCAQLDCTPDIWALHDWSVWITPFSRPGGRRFETTFFLCCLNEPPPVFPDLVEVVDCQIEDPGCFWVVIKGCSPFLDHEVDYQKLNSAMNDFYNSLCQDIEIKPLKLEEGQVCVVYCQELKCWCRAVIKSIVSSADHYLAECFLVDFARYIPVKSRK